MTNFHEIAAILEDTCSAQIGDREEIGSGRVLLDVELFSGTVLWKS